MKCCIVVQEIFKKELIVEADSLIQAIDYVENEYIRGNIVLTVDDFTADPEIHGSDLYSEKELEEAEVDYDIRNSSGRNSKDWRRHIQYRFQQRR